MSPRGVCQHALALTRKPRSRQRLYRVPKPILEGTRNNRWLGGFRPSLRLARTLGLPKCICGLLGVLTNTMQALTTQEANGKTLTTPRRLLPSAHHDCEQGEPAASRQEKNKTNAAMNPPNSRGSRAAPARAAPADARKLSMNSSRPALGTKVPM